MICNNAGTYYVGDPGDVLPADELRQLFHWLLLGNKTSEFRVVYFGPTTYSKTGTKNMNCYSFLTPPNGPGDVYDQHKNPWSSNWGVFGCVPIEIIDEHNKYEKNVITFNESFDLYANETGFTIGHLKFTYNPL